MKMSHDPSAYKIFLSPGLASGCIALMTAIKDNEEATPFSYEYGYLCFRILLLSLGASLLSRLGDRNLERAVELMQDPRYDICLMSDIFSAQIAWSLNTLVRTPQETGCDWALGWEPHKSHPPYDEIISREEAKALIDILWEDRVGFLRAMRLTFIPGLAALLFLNWRYGCLEHKYANVNSHPWKQIREIHWRCLLVITANQDDPVSRITDHFCVLTNFDPRKRKSLFEKSKDSRAILEAYISRLAPIDPAMYDAYHINRLSALLDLVTPNLEVAVEDLLPTLFKVTLDRLWEVVRGKNCTYDSAILGIALTLEQLRIMFKSLRENNLTRHAIARILEELVRSSILDLIASLFMLLDPDAEENSKSDIANFNLIQTTNSMIYELSLSTPPDLLRDHFQDYTVSWFKICHHFDYLRLCIPDAEKHTERNRRRDKHYESCILMWENIFHDLEQMDNLHATRELTGRCLYHQCQDPAGQGRLGGFYICPRCLVACYCSTRCQIGQVLLSNPL
ncbi:hypothetical protein RSOL_107890 [Rhizoctonia solani AG-3 Rhs1AP]|uniref:MYND-type domain-containing protein n=2 Tax=Rhizoctonia solani AG-3 TaxID=1086053 RepID=A0A074SI52_9AGAM|nr:hypothetical protein RSOL_107890 [Rhizoctonia solani AG-3 Rhs1AP]KEP49672.1 hypothetical protein V565_095600 [Rhizoctonia solani 123E]